MDEKTKKLDLIEDLNLSETKEITKEINSLDDLKDIENEEVTEEFNINDKEREELLEKEVSEETNLNETKEVSTTNNVKEKQSNKTNNIAYENDKKEEPPEKSKKDKVKNNKKKSKKPLIISIVVIFIIILIIVVLLFLNNNKSIDNRSKYYKAIENSLDSGKLSDTFDYVLKKLKVDATHAKLLAIDIDSDKSLDLVAYIENKNQNYILNFEVDDGVYYEENYEISEIKNFGYAYSYIDNNLYWFTINNHEYTVISNGKKIMSKEEFEENYYIVTIKYDNSNILDDAIDYDLDDDLDIEELEKNKITKKSLLKSNNLTTSTVEDKAIKYFTDKQKEQEKLAKEKEEQEKLEAEERKKNAGFTLGEYTMKYGKYVGILSDMKETITLNYDLTATYESSDGKTYTCTWTVGTATDGQDALTAVEAPAVNLTCNGINLSVFAQSKTALRDTDLWVYNYAG